MPNKLVVATENEAPRLLLALDAVNSRHKLPVETRSRHVVLAEDDLALRTILASRLRKAGYLVTECANGVELLHELEDILDRRHSPEIDLIISDIRMPGLSGMEVLEGLRELNQHIPVILITAFGSEDLHAQARRLGASATFDKPFDVETLISEVSRLV
jgi:CheY-like chemotaxis protein